MEVMEAITEEDMVEGMVEDTVEGMEEDMLLPLVAQETV